MISRTTIGSSFGGVVSYQFEGRKEQPSDKQAEVLAAVGVRADSAAHMTADFNRGRQLNPNLGQAVWHTSLSFNPDDAAKLDSAKMLAIAEGYVQKMGLDKTQYTIIRHHDQPDNQHLHIVANRVADDGQTIKDGQNFFRSKRALQELIQEYGLTPPQGLRPEKQHLAQLQGAELTKHKLRQALHEALVTATTRPALLATLQAQQISTREFANKAGEVTGISFEKDGTVFKGSQLGRGYSLASLDQQLAANQFREQVEQVHQAEAQEAAAQEQRQVAAQAAQRQEAERQAAQLAAQRQEAARQEAQRQEAERQAVQAAQLAAQRQQAARQEAERQAVQAAQRLEAERQAAQAAKVPELPVIERKWQADYQHYMADLTRKNNQHRAFNKLIDSYSEHLKIHPTEKGIAAVMRAIEGDANTVKLQADLARQVKALAYQTQNWEITYGQQAALEKQAKGGLFGKNKASRAAEEKIKRLLDPDRPLPDVLQPELREFAFAVRAAKPTRAVGIEARAYYLPEVVGLSLAEYAAKREAERQVVVRISQPTSGIKLTGRVEVLQRMFANSGAQVSIQHTTDTQGNRLSEVVVQYSVQRSRNEMEALNSVLDWAAKQPGHVVQEREADRMQRQTLGQQDAQQVQEQVRSSDKSQGLSHGKRL